MPSLFHEAGNIRESSTPYEERRKSFVLMNDVTVFMIDFICKALPDRASEAFRLLTDRAKEYPFNALQGPYKICFTALPGDCEGFYTTKQGNVITIEASKTREFIAAVGSLLRRMRRLEACGEAFGDYTDEDKPLYALRYHYMPSHFGNSFEVAWEREMQRYLEDMALAGAGGYGEWFDTNDMTDPYDPHGYGSVNFSMSFWRKKKRSLKYAKKLGLDIMLVVAHNVVFVNQLEEELRGERNPEFHVQGQVLCASNPAAREVCYQNYRNLFSDLSETGVEVDKLVFCPYDDGGCACNKCQPNYYVKFLGMVDAIMGIAQQYYPSVAADICGWWTSKEEFEQLRSFSEKRDWLQTFQYSVTYGVMGLPSELRNSLGKLGLSTFLHIAYSHVMDDRYMAGGFHAAPDRLRTIIRTFRDAGCLGIHTYNEGFGEHLNMVLSTLLARDPDADTDAVIEDYCMELYGLGIGDARRIRQVICEIQYLDYSKAEGHKAILAEVRTRVHVPLVQPWMFDQLYYKAILMALDHQIGEGGWSAAQEMAPFLSLIEERLLTTEIFFRQVYGIGIPRHVFVEEWHLPKWYKTYKKLSGINDGRIAIKPFQSKHA